MTALHKRFGVQRTDADNVEIRWSWDRSRLQQHHPSAERGVVEWDQRRYDTDAPPKEARAVREHNAARTVEFTVGESLPHRGPKAMLRILRAAEEACGRRIQISGWRCTSTRKTFSAWGRWA